MLPVTSVAFSLAYILGLLATAIPAGGAWLLGSGIALALLRRRPPKRIASWLRSGPTVKVWLLAGTIGLLAALYMQVRTPQPGVKDISQQLAVGNPQELVTVRGRIETMPRLTQGNRKQVWFKPTRLSRGSQSTALGSTVGGRLYVTLPPSTASRLHPGQTVEIAGALYRPRPAANPQAFDFQKYLQTRGAFAGLRGFKAQVVDSGPGWGWWAVRERIAKAQARYLGEPEGPLVSAMVLGGRAIDLPWDLKHAFTRVGLAHALAASGFQISLILGVLIALSRRFAPQNQVALGVTALVGFACLSGFEPSILRAVVMGTAGLIGLSSQRRTNPLGLLLGAAVLLLVLNPLWIWDLGFQFSFLATLGLIVTVPGIGDRLDCLPPTIATLIAVPVAAWIWTLPLQLFTFGTMAPYSVLANLMTSPLISGITMGGFVSGLISLVWPWAGGLLAWLLYYPCQILIGLVAWLGHLPGSAWAMGTIALWQLLGLYGLFLVVWLGRGWQRHWPVVTCVALSLMGVPVWQSHTAELQATILADTPVPILVVQEQGTTTLLNVGDRRTANLTVLPFLRQRGVNQIEWAIATDTWLGARSGWPELMAQIPVKTFSPLPDSTDLVNLKRFKKAPQLLPLQPGPLISVGSLGTSLIRSQPLALQFTVGKGDWLLLSGWNPEQLTWLKTSRRFAKPQVLWWSGQGLSPEFISLLEPQTLIVSSRTISPKVISWLQSRNIPWFWTERDGALRWTPQQQFERTLEPVDAIEGRLF